MKCMVVYVCSLKAISEPPAMNVFVCMCEHVMCVVCVSV